MKPIYLALDELGQKEYTGGLHNPRILAYHKETDLNANEDEVPWCSAFVNYCFAKCGIEGTRKANARSWLNWGNPTTTPKAGDVCIFSRGSNVWEGHVAFFLSENATHYFVLGGNQSDAVTVTLYSKERLLGIRTL